MNEVQSYGTVHYKPSFKQQIDLRNTKALRYIPVTPLFERIKSGDGNIVKPSFFEDLKSGVLSRMQAFKNFILNL